MDGLTDWLTDKSNYYRPHRVNPASKIDKGNLAIIDSIDFQKAFNTLNQDNKITIYFPQKKQTKYKNKMFKIKPDFIHDNNKHNIIKGIRQYWWNSSTLLFCVVLSIIDLHWLPWLLLVGIKQVNVRDKHKYLILGAPTQGCDVLSYIHFFNNLSIINGIKMD